MSEGECWEFREGDCTRYSLSTRLFSKRFIIPGKKIIYCDITTPKGFKTDICVYREFYRDLESRVGVISEGGDGLPSPLNNQTQKDFHQRKPAL